MQRSAFVWGVILILLGGLLLLSRLGILTFNFWSIVWPLVLIAIGLSIFIGSRGETDTEPEPAVPQHVVMRLKGADSAEIRLHLNNGRLALDGDTPPDELMNGTFSSGVEHTARDLGEGRVEVTLYPKSAHTVSDALNEWRVALNPALPLKLLVDRGSGDSVLDLHRMNLNTLDLRVGSGRLEVKLPEAARGLYVAVLVDSGDVRLHVPEHIAGNMQQTTTTGTFEVDPQRFPPHGDAYQSPDYETAESWVEITATIGTGHIIVG